MTPAHPPRATQSVGKGNDEDQLFVRWSGRIGYAAKGSVYFMIGGLALMQVLGIGGDSTGSKRAMVSTVVLALVSLMTFGNLAEAIWAPLIFLAITSLEGAVITPLVLGNRLSLSPLAVFLSVIVWGWLWGPAGALIAVPLMSGISVILAHSRSGARAILIDVQGE